MKVNHLFGLGLPILVCLTSPLCAQNGGITALYGRSIVASLDETMIGVRGVPFQNAWRDRVYISEKGKIFHRFEMKSTLAEIGGQFEAVGDKEGNGGGDRVAKFRWAGNRLVRGWVNRRGISIQHAIEITPRGGDSFDCRMSVSRSGFSGSVSTTGHSCSVQIGNVFSR